MAAQHKGGHPSRKYAVCFAPAWLSHNQTDTVCVALMLTWRRAVQSSHREGLLRCTGLSKFCGMPSILFLLPTTVCLLWQPQTKPHSCVGTSLGSRTAVAGEGQLWPRAGNERTIRPQSGQVEPLPGHAGLQVRHIQHHSWSSIGAGRASDGCQRRKRRPLCAGAVLNSHW